MSDLTVTVCGPEDLAGLIESVTGLFHEDAGQHDPCVDLAWPTREGAASYRRELDDPAVLLLLARQGRQVAGHLVGRIREPSSIRPCRIAILESMRVAPAARGGGVGSALVQEFLGWAGSRGAEQADVSAYAANDRAQRLYARHGFVPHEVTMRVPLPR